MTTVSGAMSIVKYIGRYLGRPVIATSRIDKYDDDNEDNPFDNEFGEEGFYIF